MATTFFILYDSLLNHAAFSTKPRQDRRETDSTCSGRCASSERHAQGAKSPLPRKTDGVHHLAGFGVAGLAGGTGGAGKSCRIEQGKQEIAVRVFERQNWRAGAGGFRVTRQTRVRNCFKNRADDLVAQRA
ncbi:MAG: hypothetical protein MZV63_06700 [Marinilabiliales bacterium]|nr:hypothetical protein [Marinilabiliales bacterium]